jgi:GTPase SAR1 family protein
MCRGSKKGTAGEKKKSAEIDEKLEEEGRAARAKVKLLLLGAGESGKSTIAKQMKIIHLNGFNDEERSGFKPIIFSNVVGSMRALVEAANNLQIELSSSNVQIAKRFLEDDYFAGELSAQIAKDIKTLWSDPGIKKTFARSAEFQLNDSAEYYFTEVDRLVATDYVPSVQDVLRSRAKTTGIIETEFTVAKTKFTLVDVGGQRSERRKWMHCFQDVTAVIFVVALSEYDLKLYEDETTNRMHEALKLFKDICNTKWFADTAIILFLNKKDLFEAKIKKSPLTVCFDDYKGPNTYEEAARYIEDQFLAQNENPKKLIYTHRTCATDTDNITVVFKAVQDIILNKIIDKMF